ncbi:hypothetical protein [Bauldia sp.]
MLYLISAYWPFLLAALIVGLAVGWWYQDPRNVDDMTAWLEGGGEER